jgi:hypothetical protein
MKTIIRLAFFLLLGERCRLLRASGCTCYDIFPYNFSDPMAYCTCYDIFPCNFSDLQ